MKYNASRTAFERYLESNPDLSSPIYIAYVAKGGKRWGYHYRTHHAAEFDKRYQNFWLKNPQLWEADYER